jgi:hypothetical protein
VNSYSTKATSIGLQLKRQKKVQLFEHKQVRTIWDAEQEKWLVSIIDVIAALTDSVNPNAYWRKLKQRLKAERNQTVTNCHALKMRATDGKMIVTDVADTEQLFRLVQSVPSSKAEPLSCLKELESKTGKKVVSPVNAKSALRIDKSSNRNNDLIT